MTLMVIANGIQDDSSKQLLTLGKTVEGIMRI